MDTYKTPGGQSSPRDQKIFNLDQNSIEPHIEEIRTVFKHPEFKPYQKQTFYSVIVEQFKVWFMVKYSNSKSINQLDPLLDLLVLLLNFLATVDEHHFQLLNIATKNNKKIHIVF